MIVEPFKPYHADLLRAQGVQKAQERQVSYVPASYASVFQPIGPAITARDGDRIVICGGMVTMGPDLGLLWAIMAADAGRHMLFITRGARRFIDMYRVRRLEATVEFGFLPGCRWLELLGFEFEGYMKGYGQNGETHIRFGRVRM